MSAIGSVHVAVVDDQRLFHEVTKGLLRRVFHEESDYVDYFFSGSSALEVHRRWPFDLIITDNRMPGGMSGIELAQVVRATDQTVRIILQSGDEEDVNRVPLAAFCEALDMRFVHKRSMCDEAHGLLAVINELTGRKGNAQ